MHYAILNSSGNALEWFDDEDQARAALAAMLAEFPDADVDLVGFDASERPVEPVTSSVRSAWPTSRLVWSNVASRSSATPTRGNVTWGGIIVNGHLVEPANATDDRAKVKV